MIYIHVPFCRSFCTYCGFYSEICRQDDSAFFRFRDALLGEIERRKDEADRQVNTLYIGGGTPSVLPPSVLKQVVEALGPSDYQEFTIEVNPDDVNLQYSEFLRSIGVNRVSMGVQSFDDGLLRWMNRRHDSDAAVRAFRTLRETGFDNISLDLIFGISYLDENGWRRSIEKALGLHPEHISAYQLSVEQDSALERMTESGAYIPASEEQCARQYEILCKTLADAGYNHYEISNFARPGFEAVHNGAYWRHVPYLGLGPAAHSLQIHGGQYRRFWNVADLDAYLQGKSGGSEILTEEEVKEEKIMLGLRTSEGIDASLIETAGIDRFIASGSLIELENGRLRIPEQRFFVSDDIISEISATIR